MKSLLSSLVEKISKAKLPKVTKPTLPPRPIASDINSEDVVQSYIWGRIGEFLRPGDVLLAESGTAQFGMPDAKFPDNVTYITQQFYSSIGYTVGSTLGAALALREKQKGAKVDYMNDGGLNNYGKGRVILLVGDGSLQMTVQEIGTMIRMGLTPIIIVINNDGYSIERCIWGAERAYNGICRSWNYQLLLQFFGADIPSRTFSIRKREELDYLLTDKTFNKADVIQVVEVHMDKFDYPWRLSGQVDLILAANKKREEEKAKKSGETNGDAEVALV